jgi:undecaprenyl-diphosphatase
MSNPNFLLQQQIKTWDMELCAFCNRRSRNFTIRNLFRLISRLGDGVFWYTLMIVLLLQYRGEAIRPVLHMILVGVIGTLMYKIIKGKTLRPRPFNVYPAIKCVGKTLDQFSFPSGHTMHAVAFGIIAVSYFPALIWLVVPFAILVGLSRPILGLHYPSDVLAGAALGALIAEISLAL